MWASFIDEHHSNLREMALWGAASSGVFTIPLVMIAWLRGKIIGKPKIYLFALTALGLSVFLQLIMLFLFSIDDSNNWITTFALLFFWFIMPVGCLTIFVLHIACCILGLSRQKNEKIENEKIGQP